MLTSGFPQNNQLFWGIFLLKMVSNRFFVTKAVRHQVIAKEDPYKIVGLFKAL